MYLKRVTLAGFKSFAHKTVLELEPGITAVVGPNGSGKSNVADAVRWAMGEQSRGRLRLGDRSEVVFAGSDGKARASLAEVSLVFDNSDGQLTIEASEVEMTRRLYRSGESEYQLMGRPVRLAELQLLLAQAQVGAGTYAVVGQGMIDQLIMGTAAERKELFEEAAGIRADELKREASLRQLERTATNLTRLRDIEVELSDRLRSLDHLAQASKRLASDEAERETLRVRLVTAVHFEYQQLVAGVERSQQELTQREAAHAAEAVTLAKRRQHLAVAKAESEAERQRLTAEIEQLEAAQREYASLELKLEARLASAQTADGELKRYGRELKETRSQIDVCERKQAVLAHDIAGLQEGVKRSETELKRLNRPVTAAQTALLALRRDQDDGTQQQYIEHALSTIKMVAQNLTDTEPPIEQVKLLVHKAGRLLSHAARSAGPNIVAELDAARTTLEAAMTARERVSEHISNLTISIRSQELERDHLSDTIEVRREQEVGLVASQARLQQFVAEVAADKQQLAAQRQAHRQRDSRLGAAKQQLHTLERAYGADDEVELALASARLETAQQTLASDRTKVVEQLSAVAQLQERLESLKARFVVEPNATVKRGDDASELERSLDLLDTRIEIQRSTLEAGSSEMTQLKARRDDLAGQIQDLEQGSRDLATVITHLDEAITTSFEAGFKQIAGQFSIYFERLFEGGKASLALELGTNGEYGIEIKANAKGKRLTSLAAMSGGERALTGVALIAAIVSASASPFVVLDEIDAALDEANSGKLAMILADLTRHTQLIVITHNRQTMAAAETLYGVTLGRGHASSLLSLRLEEAQTLAAR